MFNRLGQKKKPVEIKKIRYYITGRLADQEWGYQRLLTKLKTKFSGNKTEDIIAVLDEFVTEGLQSDARYAEVYMRQCRDSRGYGPNKVKSKLFEHQIASTHIDNVLFEDHPIWIVRAHESRHKKFGAFPETADERAKQSRFLQQRGFSFAQIKQAMTPGIDADVSDIIPPEDDSAEPISLSKLRDLFSGQASS